MISSVQQQHTISVLTSLLDFLLFSKVATTQQTDSTVHKLKPRLFYKSAQLQALLMDFHSWYKLHLIKLHRLPESVVSDRGPQFAAKLTKELNRMLGIKMKLLTAFYPQTDGQTKQMNQELEQYLRFFIDHRQKDWLEWLALAEFMVNNKIHLATKISPFMANYRRELRIGADIMKKGKVEKVVEFVERMKKVQEEAGAALKKMQEDMKRQADKERNESKE